jgi:hypothetical protein
MLVLEPPKEDETNLAGIFPSEDLIYTRLDVIEHTFTALMICKNEEKVIEKILNHFCKHLIMSSLWIQVQLTLLSIYSRRCRLKILTYF